MDQSTPYVNFSLLSKYVGQTVRLVCKAIQLSPNQESLQVETADQGTVNIHLNHISLPAEPFLCVTGHVHRDMTIQAVAIDGFGDQLELSNMNTLIGLMQKTPTLFI